MSLNSCTPKTYIKAYICLNFYCCYFHCFILVDMVLFTCGCTMVWTSPVLGRLKSNNTDVNPLGQPITPFQESVIAGLMSVGLMVGPFVASLISDNFGRKKTIVIASSIQLLAYSILSISKHIYLYYLMRFFLGFCMGALGCTLAIYISEITEKHNRGKYASMIGIFPPLGNLYGFVLGPLFSVRMFSFLCAVPSFIFLPLSIVIAPESPVYLLSKGEVQKAIQNLKKLRHKTDVSEDLKEIESILKSEDESKKSNWSSLFNPNLRRILIIGFGLSILQALSGIFAIMAFLGPIFDSADISMSGNTVAIIVGLVKILTFVFTSSVVEKSGRRPLVLISAIFTCIAHFLLGGFFHLKAINFIYIKQISWLSVVCILLFIISYSLGIGPITLVYLTEIFPISIKSLAFSLTLFTFTLASMIATFSFPFLVSYFGIPICFWIFSGCCGTGAVFVYFVVPETKGRTLSEIQEMLGNIKR